MSPEEAAVITVGAISVAAIVKSVSATAVVFLIPLRLVSRRNPFIVSPFILSPGIQRLSPMSGASSVN
jgi:hypothetical protein